MSRNKKMFAVFDRAVAEAPEALKNPGSDFDNAMSLERLLEPWPLCVAASVGDSGFMAYSCDEQNPDFPISFSVLDDIFCLFQGHIEITLTLRMKYGLSRRDKGVSAVIKAYITLQDRGLYPDDRVMRDLKGKFAFILCDRNSKSLFVAGDADGSVPFFWGAGANNDLVLSDDEAIMKRYCRKSFAQFPKGCIFTSSEGLRSFEFPRKALRPTPWADSSGEVCGSTFVVDDEAAGRMRFGSFDIPIA